MFRGHIVVGELSVWCHTDTVTKKPSLYNLTKTILIRVCLYFRNTMKYTGFIIIVFQIDKVPKVVY